MKYRVSAFDSIVTVVEREISWFDMKLCVSSPSATSLLLLTFRSLSTYAIVFGLLGSLGYYAYLTYMPQPKKIRKTAVSAPIGPVSATGSTTGYQEEWIPEHHLKKAKGKKAGTVSSGNELSGGETSGAEGRKKKGRK